MSANLPSDAAEKNLSDSSRSNSSDSVATGASSDHEQERESSKSPVPISSRSGSKSPPSNLQTIPEYQLLQVSPSPPRMYTYNNNLIIHYKKNYARIQCPACI